MQTKTEILQACKIEGTIIKLPSIQLERKLYLEVAKALELIGGKWKGGKVAGFEFAEDPTELLAQIANGDSRNLKKEFQFFETPAEIADWLVSLADIKPEHRILEPSAGQGAIIKAINRALPDKNVSYCELMPLNQTFIDKIPYTHYVWDNYLDKTLLNEFDRIIANPPFSKNQDIDHVLKMYADLKPGGRLVSIMSKHWQISNNRKETEFREWLQYRKAELHTIPAGAFKSSGTMISCCIVVLNKPPKQQEPQKQKKPVMAKVQNEAIALSHMISPTDVFNQSLLYFIHGGKIHPDTLNELFGKLGKSIESERKARFTWCSKTDGKTIDQIAHQLWQENLDLDSDANPETSDWRDAIEEIIIQYNSPVQMAKDFINKLNPQAIIPEPEPQEQYKPQKPQEPETQISQPETQNLQLVRYSDRAIALIGDTKQIKDKLRELWGSYNPHLKINGQTVKGWVFSAKRESQLRQLIAS